MEKNANNELLEKINQEFNELPLTSLKSTQHLLKFLVKHNEFALKLSTELFNEFMAIFKLYSTYIEKHTLEFGAFILDYCK